MTYVTSGACVSCGSCATEYPVGATSEEDSQHVTDADIYIDYETYAAVCPTGVISED